MMCTQAQGRRSSFLRLKTKAFTPLSLREPFPAQPLLQTLPVRDLELNKEYFQVLGGKEVQMGHMVRGKDAITYQQTSSYAVNLFRSYFFSPNSVKMTVGKYWQLFLGR